MRKTSTRDIAITGIFAALIFLFTAYVLHIPIGASGGYIHLGDAMLYLCASLLPAPYALAAGAIGAGFADVLTGSTVWLLASIIVKPLVALCFTSKQRMLICKRNWIALGLGGLISVAGYFIAGLVITGSFAVTIVDVPMNLLQAVGNGVFYLLMAGVLDRANLKAMLLR